MNCHDPFEDRLRRQRWQEMPPGWRAEILTAASRSASGKHSVSGGPNWVRLAREWMWPHPRAWAGLAAAWVLVIVLNWPAGEGYTRPMWAVTQPLPVSPDAREMLREQQRLLADLSVSETPRAKATPQPAGPPRRQGRAALECLNA